MKLFRHRVKQYRLKQHRLKQWIAQGLPGQCLLCSEQCGSPHGLCKPCRRDLPWLGHQCRLCALPLPGSGQHLCGQCLNQPPAFDRVIAAFEYAYPVDRLITRFKHHRDLLAGRLLAQLFIDKGVASDTVPDRLIPVPLHWRRHLVRSFNQSAFLATQLARPRHLPVSHLARRQRATPGQQTLNRRQRLHNLKQAFSLRPQNLKGQTIALVDDVMTTGATAEALGRLLKRAGAERVEVWCLARTPIQAGKSPERGG